VTAHLQALRGARGGGGGDSPRVRATGVGPVTGGPCGGATRDSHPRGRRALWVEAPRGGKPQQTAAGVRSGSGPGKSDPARSATGRVREKSRKKRRANLRVHVRAMVGHKV
jgi:hypothetical protein